MEILSMIKEAIVQTTLWEWLAVSTGLLYVILISYEKIAAWFFAIISSILYVYVCYSSQLFLETGLQFFYVVMGVYGWLTWNSKKDGALKIKQWSAKKHALNLVLSSLIFIALGSIFDLYTQQANPYTDSFTTVFSLTATYMVSKKILENWIYWIVIDMVSIYLYASRELYLSTILFTVFTLVAVFGYFKWRKTFISEKYA